MSLGVPPLHISYSLQAQLSTKMGGRLESGYHKLCSCGKATPVVKQPSELLAAGPGPGWHRLPELPAMSFSTAFQGFFLFERETKRVELNAQVNILQLNAHVLRCTGEHSNTLQVQS